MIRTTRLCLLGKNYSNIPIFTQRAATLPKQIFLEFSIVADEEKKLETQQRKQLKPATDVVLKESFRELKPATDVVLKESFGEIKYTFLRDIFQGGKPKGVRKEAALRDFMNSLPNLKPPEIIKVMKLITETNSRPILSLRTLCGLLVNKSDWKYKVKESADVLYCLSRLSYRDQALIRLIGENLLMCKEYTSPKVAGFIMHDLASLRFRDPKLIDQLLKFVLSSSHPIKTSLHCLKAASLLNYTSDDVDQIIKNLVKLKEVDFTQSTDYVDFIWSCVILNKGGDIGEEHISTVLSESYVTRLINSGVHSAVKWKLLNINGAASQMPSYKGPLLNNQNHYKILSLTVPNQRSSFLESVSDVFGHIIPKQGSIKSLVNTGAGFCLDFEYMEKVANAKTGKEPKIGIMLLNFNDICSDGTLSGLAAFKLKLMQRMGYKMVLLRYSEYSHSHPLSEKIKIIEEKLKSAGDACKDQTQEKVLDDLF